MMKLYVQKALGAALSAVMLLSAPAFAAGNDSTEAAPNVVLEETANLPPVVSDTPEEALLIETPAPDTDSAPTDPPVVEPIPSAPSITPAEADQDPELVSMADPNDTNVNTVVQTEPAHGAVQPAVPAQEETEAQRFAAEEASAGVSLLDVHGFTDVSSTDWYANLVAYCNVLGWMNGVSATQFSPAGNMERAMMAAVLGRVRCVGFQEYTENTFRDVSYDAWYYNAVVWAANAGLMNGYSETEFAPNAPISREQFVTTLWREAGSPASSTELTWFADAVDVSDWAAAAVSWAVEQQLIYGTSDGFLYPKSDIIRAEAAAILYRYYTGVKGGAAMLSVVETALKQVGYLEKDSKKELDDKTANAGRGDYTKFARDLDALKTFYNGPKQGFAWCDVFVDWCFVQTYGVIDAKKLLCQPNKSMGASCTQSSRYYKNAGRFFNTPKVGDQIFFRSDGKIVHTGLVYAVDNQRVYAVEGNTSGASGVIENGGGVSQKSYSLDYEKIYGYGRPDYSVVR